MDPIPNAIEICGSEITQMRRRLGALGPELFGETYLKHHCSRPPSPMHGEVYKLLQDATVNRGQRIAIAGPRYHAKSTIVSLITVLWVLAYRLEEFVWIVSATQKLASKLFKNVKDELEKNPKLRQDFPDLCPAEGKGGRPTPWRGDALQLPSGAAVLALSQDQKIRGFKHGQHRPGLIIVDDLETDEGVQSAQQRDKLRDYFEKTLLKAGDDRTNVVVIGTILHYDSRLAELLDPAKSPGWTQRKYKALITPPDRMDLWDLWGETFKGKHQHQDQTGPVAARAFFEANSVAMHAGAKVLWPDCQSLVQLMEMRLRDGQRSFDSEMQNEPLDPQQCLFKPDQMCYWDDQYRDEQQLLEALGPGVSFYGAWDPSLGSVRGDFGAIVIVAKPWNSKIFYVLKADIARRSTSDAIARIVAYHKMYRFTRFAVESNSFQSIVLKPLRDAAAEAGMFLNVVPVQHSGNKIARIQLLEPALTNGYVRLRHKDVELTEQLRQFPLGANDDAPDALEMAVETAKSGTGRVSSMTLEELDRQQAAEEDPNLWLELHGQWRSIGM